MPEREKEFPIHQGEREERERKDEDILDMLREQIPDEAELQRETEEKKEKVREELHEEAEGETAKKKIGGEEAQPSPEKKNKKSWWEKFLGRQ